MTLTNGTPKLYLSAFIAWVGVAVPAILGYLEGLDGNPVNWLTVATLAWAALVAAYKDLVTHKAKPPTETIKPVSFKGGTVRESGHQFSQRSLLNLKGVHEELVDVAYLALQRSKYDFVITSGVRTKEQQQELFNLGKTPTMNSRHLTGHAIDFAALVNGRVTWDKKYYYAIANAFKQAANEKGVDIEWGGEFSNFDGPHIQLTRQRYPV